MYTNHALIQYSYDRYIESLPPEKQAFMSGMSAPLMGGLIGGGLGLGAAALSGKKNKPWLRNLLIGAGLGGLGGYGYDKWQGASQAPEAPTGKPFLPKSVPTFTYGRGESGDVTDKQLTLESSGAGAPDRAQQMFGEAAGFQKTKADRTAQSALFQGLNQVKAQLNNPYLSAADKKTLEAYVEDSHRQLGIARVPGSFETIYKGVEDTVGVADRAVRGAPKYLSDKVDQGYNAVTNAPARAKSSEETQRILREMEVLRKKAPPKYGR